MKNYNSRLLRYIGFAFRSKPLRAASLSLVVTSLSFLILTLSVESVYARGFGGGRLGGGISARPNLPSNYGSMRSVSPNLSPNISRGGLDQQASPNAYTDPNRDFGVNNQPGLNQSVDTRFGGEANVGVTPGGNVAVRGTTAAGREYGAVGTGDGSRIVAGQTADGRYTIRTRGGADNVYYHLGDDANAVVIDGSTFYRRGYDYYWPYYEGGNVVYQEVYPPPGVVITAAPPGAVAVTIDDAQYLNYDDTYYRKDGDHYVSVETPPEGAPPAAAAETQPQVDPAAVINQMGTYLASLNEFVVDYSEQRASPQNPQTMLASDRRIYVNRPNQIAAMSKSGDDQRRFLYNGEQVTVYDAKRNAYAIVAVPNTMEQMFDQLRETYGFVFPLADLLDMNAAQTILSSGESSLQYEGQETLNNIVCHKISVSKAGVYGTLWIEADEETPCPRQIELVYTSHPGQPRYQAAIERWAPEDHPLDELLAFQPPEGASQISMVPQN